MDAYQRRLAKELSQLVNEPPVGVSISEENTAADLRVWQITVEGATNTLYEGEKFILQFRFDEQYPFTSPEVKTVSLVEGKSVTM